VADDQTFSVAIQDFHFDNFDTSFGLKIDEVLANRAEVIVSTDEQDVLIEYFTDNQPEMTGVDGRLTLV